MRSLADRLRLERALRLVALLSLALWAANAAWPRGARTALLRGDGLASALPRLTVAADAESLHVELDSVPDARNAAWLAALRGAGIGVSWSGATGSAVAMEASRSADPSRGVVVLASSAHASSIVSDALGSIDTIDVAKAPAVMRLASVQGDLTLRSGAQPARVGVPAALAPRGVFVSAAAGWEPKFAIAALEESGWTVDARLFVRPDEDVVQGARGQPTLDTARYAAVVLMDSAAAEVTRGVAEFARAGGGVVLAGDANRARRTASLIAWRAGTRAAAPLGTLPGDTAWRGLSRFPLDITTERAAIALESRDGKPIVAARRHYAGRVVGLGYDQTWRWRMAGGANAPEEHRAWWSRAVASVASRVSVSERKDPALPPGAAPLASLYDVLGPPSTSSTALGRRVPFALLSNLLGALALSALLAEWLLRRSRGAR